MNWEIFAEFYNSFENFDYPHKDSALRTWREKRSESDSSKIKVRPESDNDESKDEERMLDIAEHCFMRIADLLH